ncbi:hypothetical protein F4779DRAFT_630928 [Xylariaceae sp. FL0662B]|nr:hypothetical protein F4779DRAFT_630928 [Xylariaceae sp. FL0662B]
MAQQLVPVDIASSGANYFFYGAVQLTVEALANLSHYDANDTRIFDFGDATNAGERKRSSTHCKYMPGDPQWPAPAILDLLLGDALIKGVPPASVCSADWPQYDEAKFAEVTSNCLPLSSSRANATCTLGGLPSYIVNIQLAVNFARNLNLRMNIKNKGHDFNAKSTGSGSLSILTHFLQDIQYLGDEYPSTSGYRGPAFKIGAGVSTEQLYKAADEVGVQVTGCIARTVGIASGYVAGGGNSPLISKYGMAADQVVSMEVVLPDGRFVSVDENNFPDLFFALRGGGASTWGIVASLYRRAIRPILFLALSTPLFANLSALGIQVDDVKYVEYDALWEAFEDAWPVNSSQSGFWTFHTASRLLPASNWDDAAALRAQTAAIRASVATAGRGTLVGYNVRPAVNAAVNQTNAVNPAWRATCLFLMRGAAWGRQATPAGAYLNKADIKEPDWPQAFIGNNYAHLYGLKQRYDPWGLLYAPTSVGAEDWFVTGQIE